MLTLYYFIVAPDRLRALEKLMIQKRCEDTVGREAMREQRSAYSFYRGEQWTGAEYHRLNFGNLD